MSEVSSGVGEYAGAPGADRDGQPGRRLADLTTLHVGGPARAYVEVQTETDLIEAVRDRDRAGEPVLVLGGGSNLLVGDGGFDGTVVRVATRGIAADVSDCAGAEVTVAAGESWDAFVQHALDQEWSGVEALSGIPGLVGATPIQNVGAYGQEVAQTLSRVRTYDRRRQAVRTFTATECAFAYRDSRFKRELGRFVICSVTFQLPLGALSAPIRYAELARTLGVDVGERAVSRDVRQAVLRLRGRKGMVLDPGDHDTWSAGSFFTNPLLDATEAARLPADAPRYPAGDARVKTSAAWLIEHAGFGKGYGTGPARLSTKHTLALTNRGAADAADIVALAREIRSGVQRAYGITLAPEPHLVGCSLS